MYEIITQVSSRHVNYITYGSWIAVLTGINTLNLLYNSTVKNEIKYLKVVWEMMGGALTSL